MIIPMRGVTIFFFFQAEDGIRDLTVTGVQTCALPIWSSGRHQPLWTTTSSPTLTLRTSLPTAHTMPEQSLPPAWKSSGRSEEHTSELQSQSNLVCRLLLEKKKTDIRDSSRVIREVEAV